MDFPLNQNAVIFQFAPIEERVFKIHSISVGPKQASQALRTAVRRLLNGLAAFQFATD